jgi:hypothetical protein
VVSLALTTGCLWGIVKPPDYFYFVFVALRLVALRLCGSASLRLDAGHHSLDRDKVHLILFGRNYG